MHVPISCRLLTLSAAAGVLSGASPAAAQGVPPLPEPSFPYEYAAPAAEDEVVFRSDPVVQDFPLPRHAVPAMPDAPPLPPPAYGAATAYPPAHLPYAPPVAYAPPSAYPAPGYAHSSPPRFDRARWLEDCHDRIRGVDRDERASVIGGLLGAITGGVIGNRVADGERLGGTLLGGGIGGLAGMAIGSAIGAAGDRRRDDECAWYLDSYMAQPAPYAAYSHGYGYPGHGYGYGYGYAGYTLVPVLVAVPQRQVVREIVTEEWVDEPVRSRSIPPRRHHAAPRGDKRIKLIKAK